MASPSKAELWTMISNLIKIIDQYWKFAATNTPNYVGMEDTLVQSLKGNNISSIVSYLNGFRSEINNRYESAKDSLMLLFKELAKFGYGINISGLTDTQVMQEISDAMHGSTETVKNRAYTYGSVTAGGSNVGSATVLRCTKDKNNYDLEIAEPGVQRIEIVRDKNMGAVGGQEGVLFYGEGNPRVDRIQYATSTNKIIQGKTLYTSQNGLLSNASFDQLETASAFTTEEQNSWTLNDKAEFERSTTVFYRYKNDEGAKINGTGVSLVAKSTTNDISFLQYVARSKFTLNKNVPYFLVCRVMVDDTNTDGTFTLRLGSQTATLDLATLSANAWTNVIIGTDNKGYFDNFKENWLSVANQDLGIRVGGTVASRTVAGKIYFDELILAQGILFNGCYYLPIAGRNAGGSKEALEGDYYTFTDSVSDTGRNQYTIAELLSVSLPHTSGSPTYADA